MASKGQVTLFIIIGIILIIALGGVLYYYGEEAVVTEETLRGALTPDTEVFYDYVVSCMEQIGEDGINIMGQKGGYIERRFMSNQFHPTEAEGVALSPGSDLVVPYWYYMKGDDRCQHKCPFDSQVPLLSGPDPMSMENQLDDYMNKNLGSCLEGFKPFKEEGWNVKTGDLNVTSTITEEGVNLYLTYLSEFERSGQKLSLDKYVTTVDVRLKQAYELATSLTTREKEHNYLENGIYQLISLNQGTKKEQLPPQYSVTVGNKMGTMWRKSQVKEKIQNLVTAYVPLMQVFGTGNYEYLDAPGHVQDKEMFEQLYNRNMLVLPDKDYLELEARYTYLPWWEPYFDLNCRGELCRGDDMMSMKIIPMTINRYQFSYDMSFPVLITIKDDEAFNTRGFTFQFMLESNIRNGHPVASEYDFIVAEQVSQNLFCDPGQRLGTRILLDVTDAKTGDRISEANTIFSCGSQQLVDSCAMGLTTNGNLTVQLPKCLGGSLSVSKEGYAPKSILFDSDRTGDKEIKVQLEPARQMNFELKRFLVEKGAYGWTLDGELHGLNPDEEATIIMTRRASEGEQPYEVTATIFGATHINERQGNWANLTIYPGTYDVDISTILVPSDPIVIPPQVRKFKKGIFSEGTYIVPETPMIFDRKHPLSYGGARYTVTIDSFNLDNFDTMVFKTIDFALDRVHPESARVIEDLDQMANIEQYSAPYAQMLYPHYE